MIRGECRCGAMVMGQTASESCPACEMDSLLGGDFFDESEYPECDGLEILNVIGEGGMGRVYRAVAVDPPRRTVAVKVIKGSLRQRELNVRFQREIEGLARLDHPGVCRVLSAGQTRQAEPYYVMEYIEGESLLDYLEAREEGLSDDEKMKLALEMVSAVGACHAAAVVHRDLSPRNLLVTEAGRVKLLDFGIVKLLAESDEEANQAQTIVPLGTPGFMAPEQGRVAGRIEMGTDVYVLGMWLVRIFTGEFPEAGAERRIVGGKLSGDLRAVIYKALQEEVQERYRSAGDLEDDLRRVRGKEPVSARQLTTLYFFQTWFRMYRGRVMVGALMVAIFSGMVWYSWQGKLASAREVEAVRVEKLTSDLVLAAEAKGVQGNWGDALVDLGRAIERGHARPDEVRLLMVEAALAMGDRKRAEQEFDRLEGESSLRSYWAGHLSQELKPALQFLRESLEGDLPVEKALVARALLSDSAKERVMLLKGALAERAYDHQALSLLALNQIWTSEVAEATERLRAGRYLFPDDENLTVLLILGEALQERMVEVRALTQEYVAEGRLTESEEAEVELMLKGVAYGRQVYDQFWSFGVGSLMKSSEFREIFAPLAWKRLKSDLSPLAEKTLSGAFPSLGEITPLLVFGRSKKGAGRFLAKEMARDFPREIMMYLGVAIYFSEVGSDPEDREAARFLEKACGIGYKVARNSGLRALFLELGAIHQYMQAQIFDSAEHDKRARELLGQRLSNKQPFARVASDVLLKGVFVRGHDELRRDLLQRLGAEAPERFTYLFHLAKAREESGHYFAALEALEVILDSKDEQYAEQSAAMLKRVRAVIEEAARAE